MKVFFWVCLALIVYSYAIYPVVLVLLNRVLGRKPHVAQDGHRPTVTILMPVHNEAGRVPAKVRNLLALDYPPEKLQILVIGDGCTDDSLERAASAGAGRVSVHALPQRAGKAAALNAGLALATGDILVFTDAGIILDRDSLGKLVAHFHDPAIGCVSGEDYIEGNDTEGLYGRIELTLRREEARLHSIAGASGCFYGKRREICTPFVAGMAPDFLSVLVTVRAGRRAIAEPAARGSMTATSSQRAEFTRKVRTILRGVTALFGNVGLMNPFRYPEYALVMWSHKFLRWFVPVPMIGCLVASFLLRGQPLYAWLFVAQVAAYVAAILGMLWPKAARIGVVRLAAFFVLVNAASLKALLLWLGGERLEVWQPTQRPK